MTKPHDFLSLRLCSGRRLMNIKQILIAANKALGLISLIARQSSLARNLHKSHIFSQQYKPI